MPRVAKLSADLTANTSNFETGLKRANNQMKGTRRLFQNELGQISTSFKALAGIAVGFLAIGKLSGDFKKAINYMDDMSDAAARVGISSEAFSKLAFASKQAEVPVASLEKALRKMMVALVEASGDPSGKVAKALDTIGLSADGLRKVGADEALAQIADGMNRLDDAGLKAAVGQTIFGKGVASVSDLLSKGGTAIRAYGADAERFGIVVSQDAADKAEQFKEAMGRIEAAYQGMILRLADEGALDSGIAALEAFGRGLDNLVKNLQYLNQQWKIFSGNLDKGNLEDLNIMINEQGKRIEKATPQSAFGRFSQDLDRKVTGASQYDIEINKIQELFAAKDKLKAQAISQSEQKKQADEIDKNNLDSKLQKERAISLETSKRTDKVGSILSGLQLESSELAIQVDMYGQKEGAINRARRELQINNEITAADIALTKEQRTQLDAYLDQIETQGNLYEDLEAQSKKLADQERDREQALSQLGATFESAFEDAIINGEELSDVIQGLTQDILKLALRTTITAPLGNALTSFFSGGGGAGFSSIMSAFSSHATGIDYVPRDMTARIHKGEKILTAKENRDSSSGGGDVVVNVINNTDGKVSASQSDNGSGMQLDIMIDQVVAQKINTPGSRTNQAIGNFNNRTLVKR